MARMLGSAGYEGTGCMPRCRASHRPRPKFMPKVMRARETRSWRREWAEGDYDAATERHTLEWMRLRPSGRRMLEFIEAIDGPLGVWNS